MRTEFPAARLAVPYRELSRIDVGGTLGSRVAALPVSLGDRVRRPTAEGPEQLRP